MNENENKNVQIAEEESQANSKNTSSFWAKASSMGKKVADNVQKGAIALSDKAKEENYQRKMEKYNPLFPKEFKSKGFLWPRMIRVVDNASIQSIDVCEGAIGWRDRSTEIEVLFLSSDVATSCSITFYPSLISGALYCIDAHDNQRYVNVERIFSKAHEEKLAELEHIAYMLGAKRCSVELLEADSLNNQSQKSMSLGFKLGISHSGGKRTNSSRAMSGKTVSTFNGNNSPVHPDLKWFKNDHNILNLIEMRCSDANSIHARTLVLEGSSSIAIDHSQAAAIDLVIKGIGIKLQSSLEKQYESEYNSKLVYEVEF